MFAFVIYNKDNNSVFAARDRFGIKPLFFYKSFNKFVIASEKKAIFKLGIEKKINKSQLANYVAHGVYQHNKETFYEKIDSLEPGHYLKIDKSFNITRWDNHNFKINKKISFKDAQFEFKNLFKKSIKLCLRSDKKVSIALSGGVDSSAIAYYVKRNQNKKFTNELVHWTCKDEHDESIHAQTIAKLLKKNLKLSIFTKRNFSNYIKKGLLAVEEPFGGLNNISAMKMFEKLRNKKSRVILDGNGADEILGGYEHHIKHHMQNKMNYFMQPIQGLNINYHPEILQKKYYENIKTFKIKRIFNSHLKNSMYNDLCGTKLRRSLYQQDHIAMKNSLEMRFPFLNNDLVNFCYSLPDSYLVNYNLGKFILRKSFRNEIFNLEKRANQTPQTYWIKNFIIDKLIKQIKYDDKINDFKIFDQKKLIEKLNIWKRKDIDNSVFPWQILMIYNMVKFYF